MGRLETRSVGSSNWSGSSKEPSSRPCSVARFFSWILACPDIQLYWHNERLKRFTKLPSIPRIVGALVFRQRTIVEYAQRIPKDRISILAFEDLASPEAMMTKLPTWIAAKRA